jgi:hypothetical protein
VRDLDLLCLLSGDPHFVGCLGFGCGLILFSFLGAFRSEPGFLLLGRASFF